MRNNCLLISLLFFLVVLLMHALVKARLNFEVEIALTSRGSTSSKTIFGFVPVINFRFNRIMMEKPGLLPEGDALAKLKGRAEDVLLAATYKFNRKIAFKAGYRILEGGADNDEVYNFSLFNYLSAGAIIVF